LSRVIYAEKQKTNIDLKMEKTGIKQLPNSNPVGERFAGGSVSKGVEKKRYLCLPMKNRAMVPGPE
jgi:hypothetical protein